MDLNICCVCLDSRQNLKFLNSIDQCAKTVLEKLKEIAPDQEWLEDFLICKICDTHLENAFFFKQLCIKNEGLRKELQDKKEAALCIDIDYEPLIETFYNNIKTESGLPQKPSKNEEKVICFHCRRSFHSKAILIKHIKVRHTNLCFPCRKTFKTKRELAVHNKNAHPKLPPNSTKFQCEVCGKFFSLLKNITDHCVTVHLMEIKDVKPYRCTECDNKFASSTLLLQHKKYHVGKRSFTCVLCGKSFITKKDLNSHEKLHENQRNYSCDKCEKTFNTNPNLRTHIYVCHTDSSEWKYSCPVCSKRFAMKANCNEHVKRHQGNKDFVCHICKKMFISSHELKKHVKLHSNIASFKCEHCSKHYRAKRSLDLHLSKTHGIGTVKATGKLKKFVCHICPSQFFDKNKLQRHIRTHTGVKPFGCNGCDKRFIDKSYLTHHVKGVHHIVDPAIIKEYIQIDE